jgi:amidophosphoribosyltransferase
VDSGWAVASETCALDHIGAEFVREIEPDEIVIINENGAQSYPGDSVKITVKIFRNVGEHQGDFIAFDHACLF